jgi:hypothetical protein
MGDKRAKIDLNNDEDEIGLEQLLGSSENRPLSNEEQHLISNEAEKLGFIKRQGRTPRKRSPYLLQKNIKMRIGMPELLSELTSTIKAGSDQETIEIALGVLIESLNLKEIKEKYKSLINKNN